MAAAAATASGPPEKRRRLDCDPEDLSHTGLAGTDAEAKLETSLVCQPPSSPEGNQSPAGPCSAQSSNGSDGFTNTSSSKEEEEEETPSINPASLMEMISKSLLSNVFKLEEVPARAPSVPSPLPQTPSIPGALAVAATPTAQLFAEDDWSWHRNPAASIRSGGTNKQTPVWKYFVYNKTENLSRCIIADCTYSLKGPHTSTLACHLKKHPLEYQEFRKLKADYTRERGPTGMPPSPASSTGGSSAGGSTGNPSSAGSSSAGSTANLQQVPVAKKEKENHDRNGNHKPVTESAPVTAVPRILPKMEEQQQITANLLNPMLNPLNFPHLQFPFAHLQGMFAAQQVPTSSACVSQQAALTSQMLKQHGVQLGVNGQLMLSKKWRREEKKQKELESRLALLLAAGRIDAHILNNPFFRDFMETAQPKFNLPDEPQMMEKLLCQHEQRIRASLRSSLSSSSSSSSSPRRISLLLDSLPHRRLLCVSAALVSLPAGTVEIALLGVRPVEELTEERVKDTVEKVLSEYGVDWNGVSRVVCEGGVLEGTLPAYAPLVLSTLTHALQHSQHIHSLRAAVRQFAASVCRVPELLQQAALTQDQLSDSVLFDSLAETVVGMKHEVLPLLSVIPDCEPLTEQQWSELECLNSLVSLFRTHAALQQWNGEVATVDGVVPSLLQLLKSLDKDFGPLTPLCKQIADELRERSSSILCPSSPSFDGTWLRASALNPQLLPLLDDSQLSYAKGEIEKAVAERMRREESTPKRTKTLGVDSLLASVIDRQQCEVSPDQAAPLSTAMLYPDLLQAAQNKPKTTQEKPTPTKNRYAEAMVQTYFEEIAGGDSGVFPFGGGSFLNRHLPPIAFWNFNANKCAPLAEVAIELLSIPSSTPTPHRIFSPQSSLAEPTKATPFDCSSLRMPRLERDTLINFNRSHLSRIGQ